MVLSREDSLVSSCLFFLCAISNFSFCTVNASKLKTNKHAHSFVSIYLGNAHTHRHSRWLNIRMLRYEKRTLLRRHQEHFKVTSLIRDKHLEKYLGYLGLQNMRGFLTCLPVLCNERCIIEQF